MTTGGVRRSVRALSSAPMTHAIYNEIEPYAAAWLANLVAAGHIASGVVDARSIKDLKPADVAGPGQRHFFAGIGVWSHALRLAGWPDDVSVWTGSCPCQPFSTAGRKRGVDDERHLWPVWFELIRECRPAVILGEQVASADGLAWLDAVRADLEGAGYAFAASDLCAAGVGAPHLRQRLYFVAYDNANGRGVERSAHHVDGQQPHGHDAHGRRALGRLADSSSTRLEGHTGDGDDGSERAQPSRSTTARGTAQRLVDTGVARGGWNTRAVPCTEREGARERQLFGRVLDVAVPAGPTRGFWFPADWLACRDGKARPVEPGAFPLAHGATARVGRVRAYGNAIVAQVAATFIEAVTDIL